MKFISILKKYHKAIILFIVGIFLSYALIYMLTPSDFFKSPMYMLLPIVGFFGMFIISKYLIDYMKIKNKYYFALLFIGIAIVAYYLAIFFFYWNIVVLNNLEMKELFKFVFQNQNLFLTSAFLEFIIGGVFGILAID
jgi:hypothetical protein